MKDSTFFALALPAFVLAILAIVYGVYRLEVARCGIKYVDYEPKYGLISGCMVKVNGRWIPDERLRVVE